MGDTLVVYDARRNRFIRFGPDGDPIGTGMTLTAMVPSETRTATRVALGGNSSEVFIVQSRFPDMVGDFGIQRPPRTLLRVSLGGEALRPLDTLGTWPGRAWFLTEKTMGPLPFGPDSYLGFSGDHAIVCDGEESQAWSLNLQGLSPTRILWDDSRESVGKRRTELVEKALGQVPAGGKAQARVLLEALPFPDTLPVIGAALASEEGLWVSRWFGTEVEVPGENWPDTEWRAIQLTSPVQVAGVAIPPGVKPVRPLSDFRVLVLLQDGMGRQGVGIAKLKEVQDG